MNKVKVRCSVCGRSFKTPSAKKTICPNCEAEAKRAKHQPASAPIPVHAASGSTSVDVRAALRAAQENQGQFGAYKPPPPAPDPVSSEPKHAHAAQGAVHGHGHPGRGHGADGRPASKPRSPREAKPRPKREPKPRVVMKPFEPSEEQVIAVRERYLQLAQPEFDGIRHQIATELGIPLRAVKRIILETRDETQIQSWWERGGGLPSPENLEKIKELYMPLLPEPEIGVHKRIASELHLTNTSVYQAIGQIRADMHLDRYVPHETSEPAEQSLGERDTRGEYAKAVTDSANQPILHAAAGE